MHNSIEELCFENGILIDIIFKRSWDGIGSCADEVVDWQNADQTILMQYTGMKDKNGVEIYHGDIVEVFGSFTHEVVKQTGAFGYIPDEFTGFVSFAQNYHFEWTSEGKSNKIEVIGNRYDNPELLESQT